MKRAENLNVPSLNGLMIAATQVVERWVNHRGW